MVDRLNKIRADIDALDGELRELLRARLSLVAQVTLAKEEGAKADAAQKITNPITNPMRPAREAKQMRILAAYAAVHGLPLAALVAIWRELIGMALLQEADFTIHATPETERLARQYFGNALDIHIGQQGDALQGAPIMKVVPLNRVAQQAAPVQALLPVLGAPQAALCGVVVEEPLDQPVTLIAATAKSLPPLPPKWAGAIKLGDNLALLAGAFAAPPNTRQLGIFEAPLFIGDGYEQAR